MTETERRKRGHLAACLTAAAIVLTASNSAQAARCAVGNEEHLRPIQDLYSKGPAGEDLYLGYKFTFYSACLPYAMSDDGYIIGIKGQNRYIALDYEKLSQYQVQGTIPTPLPPYEISKLDYAVGHMLWIVFGVIPVAVGIVALLNRKRRRAVPIVNAGLTLSQRGQFAEAVAEFNKADELAPNSPGILLARARAYMGLNDTSKALEDYTRVIRIEPNNALARLERGRLSAGLENFEGAFLDFTKAVKLTKSQLAYGMRGECYAQAGEYELAIQDFTKAFELNPQSSVALRLRAAAYEQAGRSDLAKADYDKANTLQPPEPGPN